MGQSYTEFKDYLVNFLWKVGDQVLINNLDTLIRMGNAKLNRELNIERRHVSVTAPITSENYPLPADYHSIRSVNNVDDYGGEYNYVTPAELFSVRSSTLSQRHTPLYSIENKTLLLSGPMTPAQPSTFRIDYTSSIPDYAVTDSSWVEEEHLDLYTYAVLLHSASFLREDERIPVWTGLYTDGLAAVLEDSAHSQARGISAGPIKLPRAASPYKYTSVYSRR